MIIIGDDYMLIPNIIEKKHGSEVAYDLYSRLLQDRIILLNGEITDQVANIIVSELLYLDSTSNDDISIYINSPGGSVSAGLAIYDTMNFVKSDVKTICLGIAASMAALILSSGAKGKRYSLPNSEVMIHQPLGGAEGQATEIKIAAEHILKMKDKLNKILSLNTNQDIKKIENDTDRDNFMSADEALKYGIIDEIIKKK
jgi:ATP-dependent Clp protease protease subunit